jgi:hypothetical protein
VGLEGLFGDEGNQNVANDTMGGMLSRCSMVVVACCSNNHYASLLPSRSPRLSGYPCPEYLEVRLTEQPATSGDRLPEPELMDELMNALLADAEAACRLGLGHQVSHSVRSPTGSATVTQLAPDWSQASLVNSGCPS